MMALDTSNSKLLSNVIRYGGKYQCDMGRKLGAGCYGNVYSGTDMSSGKKVAVKVEIPHVDDDPYNSPLNYEEYLYRKIQGGPGIPDIFYHNGYHKVLVMELLGQNLEELQKKCGGKFSLITVLKLADQLIPILQHIHSKGVLHRDIKPGNILIGLGANADKVYLVDFGLGKFHRDEITFEHHPYREGRGFKGTPRYASLNCHNGIEISRRDDLESLGFVFIQMLKGELPWKSLPAANFQQQMEKAAEMKMSISLSELTKDLPAEFFFYMMYCRNLEYLQTPDYKMLRDQFRCLFEIKVTPATNRLDWRPLEEPKKKEVIQTRVLRERDANGRTKAKKRKEGPRQSEQKREVKVLVNPLHNCRMWNK